MRRPENSILGIACREDFTALRRRGRPPKRWKDQIRMKTGKPLGECEEAALGEGRLEGYCDWQTQSKVPLWPSPLSQVSQICNIFFNFIVSF